MRWCELEPQTCWRFTQRAWWKLVPPARRPGFAPDRTTQPTFTSVVSQSIPKPRQRQGPSSSSESRMCYSFIIWGRPSSIVVTGGCDKVLGIGMGEFFRFFLDWRVGCLHNADGGVILTPLFSPPLFLPSPSSLPAPPRPCSRLLSDSVLHIPNASSPQLSPADGYTLSRSHVRHLLLRSGLGTRLYGHVTNKREGVCTILDSSRAGARSSSRSFKNKVEDEMVMALTLSCQ